MMLKFSSFIWTLFTLSAERIECKLVCSFWLIDDVNIKANEVIGNDSIFYTVSFHDSDLIRQKP